ncbi:cytochrome P450 [Trametes cingulata]|nr:cytochrome P450 [Trametes cingulata]
MDSVMTHPLMFGSSTVAGAATFVILRGRDVRGDHAALSLTGACVAIYTVLRASPALSADPLYETLAIVSVYLLVASGITIVYRLCPWHPLAAYPGPTLAKVTSLWLSYISFTGKRYQILDDLHAQYGPFLRIGPNHLSINSPSAVSLYTNAEKSESYRFPGHNGAVALFFKQDTAEQHRNRRRIWSGLFTRTSIAGLIPQLERRTWELVRCLEQRQAQSTDGVVNLPEAMYHWSHDVMGDMVFGGCSAFEMMKNGDPEGAIYTAKTATAMMDSIGQSPWLLDILWHIPLTKKMHLFQDMAAQMMRDRVNSKDLPEYRDLASYLIAAGIPQRELETDAIVAIVGGADNTSITVSLAIYFLLANRQYYVRLREELDKAFPDPMASMNMDELAALPFLDGVLNETLRLASPYFNPRLVPAGGVVISGRYIPEKTVVALAAHSQQMSPDNFYPAPQDFRPERWQPGGLGPGTVTNKTMLASFSYGPHYCIGKNLAYHQMRFALARILLAFDIEFEEDFDVPGFRAGILNMRTMFLARELRVKVTRRPGVCFDKVVL